MKSCSRNELPKIQWLSCSRAPTLCESVDTLSFLTHSLILSFFFSHGIPGFVSLRNGAWLRVSCFCCSLYDIHHGHSSLHGRFLLNRIPMTNTLSAGKVYRIALIPTTRRLGRREIFFSFEWLGFADVRTPGLVCVRVCMCVCSFSLLLDAIIFALCPC